MADQTKKTRAELKVSFVEGAIPAADDFAALIDSGLNLADDSFDVSVSTSRFDSISSRTAGKALTLSGDGAGAVRVQQRLLVDSVSPRDAASNLDLGSGAGSSVQVADPLTVTGPVAAQQGLEVRGAGASIGAGGASPKRSLIVHGDLTVIGTLDARGGLAAGQSLCVKAPIVTATERVRADSIRPAASGDADLVIAARGTGTVLLSSQGRTQSFGNVSSGKMCRALEVTKDALGYVFIRGICPYNDFPRDSYLLCLPAGFTPPARVTRWIATFDPSNNRGTVYGSRVSITPGGSIVRTTKLRDESMVNTWPSLSMLPFRAARATPVLSLELEYDQLPVDDSSSRRYIPSYGSSYGEFSGKPITVPDVQLGARYTLSVWVKRSSNGDEITLMSFRRQAPWFGLDKLRPTLRSGSPDKQTLRQGPTAPAQLDKEWHHVALTWDGATYKLYVDAVNVSEVKVDAANPALDHSGQGLYVGAIDDFGGKSFGGSMSNVRIYDQALSDDDITDIAIR